MEANPNNGGKYLYAIYLQKSGRWDSNPRHSAWEADILPLNYARIIARIVFCNKSIRSCPSLSILLFSGFCASLLSIIVQIKAKFIDFLGSASSPHGLDAYTKQAMAIALSVAMRCEPCLKMHLKKAKEKGFTQDEIDEAAWMGISFGGSPTMVFYEQNRGT